ncbi:hypothetical protein GJ744_012126 [Endocarpon pusillum]|uniref:Cytoplasmic tRNA 2-thiolation protein 2 n=1 Tax=Endocarpon pusillum TaxID=364733 RepID=A0A8H7ADU3_9EURO|nr:hypothetical protein GJ744_012126 [Endocarpon pusillum]
MPAAQLFNDCADCHSIEASIDVRKRWLCRECFIKYIGSKPVKRVKSYRLKEEVTEQPQKLLLPVSGGVSSVVLLQILDGLLQRQFSNRGRKPYELHLLMVEAPSLVSDRSVAATFNRLKQKFPSHTCSLVPLPEVFKLDSSICEDLSDLGAQRGKTPQASLDTLLSCSKTASSRTDVLQLLLTRLIVAFAKVNACNAILWGHSNSRLAAKALSSVSKGRGGYLPFDIADGPTPWGIAFYYPLRDLFKSELVMYTNALPDDFSGLVVHDLASVPTYTALRATSIDDLLSAYIDNQGEKYPSLMANVVRTAGKLQMPVSAMKQSASICGICAMPIPETMASQESDESNICYACQRLRLETISPRGP